MLTVKEMAGLAASLNAEQFRGQLGPFVLIRRPPDPTGPGVTDKMGLPLNVATTQYASKETMSRNALSLLFEFDDLQVVTLPPLQAVDEIAVGRLPDLDVVIDDTSVSKRHAVLRWDEQKAQCTVQDLGSTNGTFLNASTMVRRETTLKDGDILSFGDVQFWFLLTETLHSRLKGGSEYHRLVGRSG